MVHQTTASLRFGIYAVVALLVGAGAAKLFKKEAPTSPQPVRAALVSQQNALAKKEVAGTVPEINWILRGTLLQGEKRKAVLEDKKTGEQQWVSQGEKRGAWVIARVDQKNVWLQGEKGEVKLAMDLNEMVSLPSVAIAEDKSVLKKNEFWVKQNQLRELASQIPRVLDSLGLILFDGDHGTEGYLISEDPGQAPLRAIGIQDGDVIRKINGRELLQDQDVLEIFQMLARQKEIKVEVDRDDEVRVLTYYVRP